MGNCFPKLFGEPYIFDIIDNDDQYSPPKVPLMKEMQETQNINIPVRKT